MKKIIANCFYRHTLRCLSFFMIVSLVGCTQQCDGGKRREMNRKKTRVHRKLDVSPVRSQNENLVQRTSSDRVNVRANGNNDDVESGTVLYNKNKAAVFFIVTSNGYTAAQGSGFFVSSNGIGVSNYHVFRDTTIGAEEITLIDGTTYKLKEVLAKNQEHDYIIFKVDVKRKVPFLRIASCDPSVGEYVFAIGNPKGVDHVFTDGKVSKVEYPYILSQTPITHGNSGGPLMNVKGEVVGITSGNMQEKHEAMFNYAVSIQCLELDKYIR